MKGIGVDVRSIKGYENDYNEPSQQQSYVLASYTAAQKTAVQVQFEALTPLALGPLYRCQREV